MKIHVQPAQFQIKVEVIVDCYQLPVVASTIQPVRPGYPIDKTIDEQAYADYTSFIADSKEELEDVGLEIVESNSSEVSKTSKYFTLIDIEQDVTHTAKYMIFLRISDHVLELDEDENSNRIKEAIRKHRDTTKSKQEMIQGHRLIWKVREIIVNGERFSNYDEALIYIRECAEQWSELLNKHSY